MTTPQDHSQDLTPALLEMQAQLAQLQQELVQLKEKAQTLPHSQAPFTSPKPAIISSSTRRKTLKRLGLALLGGAVAATALGQGPAQAKISANPQTNGFAGRVGMFVQPPGASLPTGTLPGSSKYGVIASTFTTPFDASTLSNFLDIAVYGISNDGNGVVGSSNSNAGVVGNSNINTGVYGNSNTYYGVYGGSDTGIGVLGNSNKNYGVRGNSPSSYGVYGSSSSSYGVYGYSNDQAGVYGSSSLSYGVRGDSLNNIGVYGSSSTSTGVYGYSNDHVGVIGNSNLGYGVYGSSSSSYGVVGYSLNNIGVYGNSGTVTGTTGTLTSGTHVGLLANAGASLDLGSFSSNLNIGLYALAGGNTTNYAGYFSGDVEVIGTLTANTKNFKIDHPLDPANKYLYHTSVESPDMKNIYDGVITLDNQGEATITMPDWFEALNSDFRYQLTCLGQYAPVFVAQELTNRQFKIAGGKSGQKVSWQVTGIRQDAYAKVHRSPVEEEKLNDEKGKYLHPELFDQPEEKSVSPRAPQRPGK